MFFLFWFWTSRIQAICDDSLLDKSQETILFRLARGERSPEIARRLNGRGKFGVLFATGDDARISTLAVADGEASIAKPYRAEDVVRALEIVREIATGETATPPFPPGFRLLPEPAAQVTHASPA